LPLHILQNEVSLFAGVIVLSSYPIIAEYQEAMVTQGELQDFLAFSHSDFPRNRLEATRALANFLENGTHEFII